MTDWPKACFGNDPTGTREWAKCGLGLVAESQEWATAHGWGTITLNGDWSCPDCYGLFLCDCESYDEPD